MACDALPERLADPLPAPLGEDADAAPGLALGAEGRLAARPEPALDLAEGHRGARVEPVDRRARLAQPVRERHAEAAGVGSGDQLLRARLAARVLGARRPGDGEGAEPAALERHVAAAPGEVPL